MENKRSGRRQGYAYCLTINNPTVADYMQVDKIVEDPAELQVAHFVCGWEHFNIVDLKYRKLTPHLQIAVCFGAHTPWREVKRMFPRAHIEPLRGTYVRAVDYCLKEARAIQVQAGDLDFAKFLLGEDIVEANTAGGKGEVLLTPPPAALTSPSDHDNDPKLDIEDWEFERLKHPQYFD